MCLTIIVLDIMGRKRLMGPIFYNCLIHITLFLIGGVLLGHQHALVVNLKMVISKKKKKLEWDFGSYVTVSPLSKTIKLLRVKKESISPAAWFGAFFSSPMNVFCTIYIWRMPKQHIITTKVLQTAKLEKPFPWNLISWPSHSFLNFFAFSFPFCVIPM